MKKSSIMYTLEYNKSESASPGGSATFLNIKIKNLSARVLHISQFLLAPDWDAHMYYYVACDARVNPDEEKELLNGAKQRVPVKTSLGAHKILLGVQASMLSDGGWKRPRQIWLPRADIVKITNAQSRNFTVFVSHSNNSFDKPILNKLHLMLTNCGIDIFMAEQKKKAGEDLWNKIKSGIDKSDCTLLLWTKYAADSGDVREEVGYALGKGKIIVPFAETDLGGSIKGREYVKLRRRNIESGLEEIGQRILSLAEQKIASTSQAEQKQNGSSI